MKTLITPTFNATLFIASKGTKSSAIRALIADGYLRGEVAKALNIKYQHVRNVMITPIKTPLVKVVKVSEAELDLIVKSL
jgi:hypothetical protein